MGSKIPLGVARLEHMFDQAHPGKLRSSLAMGLTEAIDAEITYEEGQGSGKVVSYDLSYNFVPPIVNLSPGFSVGVRDGRGVTEDGRFFYAAMTEKFGLTGTYNSDVPAEVSLGLGVGDTDSAFVAVMLPLRTTFRVLAEYDTRRISSALEYRPVPQFWVRWIHRPEQTLWSLTLEHKF
jgi:hypothetical protein